MKSLHRNTCIKCQNLLNKTLQAVGVTKAAEVLSPWDATKTHLTPKVEDRKNPLDTKDICFCPLLGVPQAWEPGACKGRPGSQETPQDPSSGLLVEGMQAPCTF